MSEYLELNPVCLRCFNSVFKEMITHILDALGASKFTRGYIFPPHCFYIYTQINADVSYALASRGEFYTATKAQQA